MPIAYVNKFGHIDRYYRIQDVKPPIYILNTGCVSSYTDALTWANQNKFHVTSNPCIAKSMIVLGCQSSDVHAYLSIKEIEGLRDRFIGRDFYIGGCLGRRADIKLPEGIKSLDVFQKESLYTGGISDAFMEELFIVDQKPQRRNIFDGYYPIKIGMGSDNPPNCQNIEITRTPQKLTGTTRVSKKALTYQYTKTKRSVVLVSDDPTQEQLGWWLSTAVFERKPVSLINVSPSVAILPDIRKLLISAAKCRRLSTIHSPILSDRAEILDSLGKNVSHVHRYLQLVDELRRYKVYCTTSVLVDYKNKRYDYTDLNKKFDMVNWRPWWNNHWNQELAAERLKKYADPRYKWMSNGRRKAGVVKLKR